jgi:hypothetical protein
VVSYDGEDVECFVVDCRCGGHFILTSDTVQESSLHVDKWNVECDTCSLLIRVDNK